MLCSHTCVGVDWQFNGWGGITPAIELDVGVATRVTTEAAVQAVKSSFVMEGGSFHVDGEGTLITTEVHCVATALVKLVSGVSLESKPQPFEE